MLSLILHTFAFMVLLARAAPTAVLDTSTLLQNGLDAQKLNTEFKTLRVTDACNDGETACISRRIAQCQNSTWATRACSSGNQCFALPSVRQNGTNISCTSESTADSLISAAGAQGGIFGNQTSNSTSTNNPPSASATSGNGDTNIVTVTVTIGPGTTFTLPPTTRTLTPAQASLIVGELAGNMALPTVSALPSASESSFTDTSEETTSARVSIAGSLATGVNDAAGSTSAGPASIIILSSRPTATIVASAGY